MNEKVDSGKIIHVKYFPISKNFNLKKLLNKTHKIMYTQAIEIVDGILNEKNFIKKLLKKNSQIKWSKKLYTKKQMLELYKIKKNFDKSKIKKICRATIYDTFFPYYEIKGRKFFIKK